MKIKNHTQPVCNSTSWINLKNEIKTKRKNSVNVKKSCFCSNKFNKMLWCVGFYYFYKGSYTKI